MSQRMFCTPQRETIGERKVFRYLHLLVGQARKFVLIRVGGCEGYYQGPQRGISRDYVE
jgi:hypothetical protein